MTDQHDQILSPAAEKAREALRGLPRAPADASFRARLRNDFASGQLGGRDELAARRRRSLVWSFGAPLAAAAVLVFAFLFLNRGPAWELVSHSGEGTVIVDGSLVPVADSDRLEDLLRPGAHVVLGEGARLVLRLPDRLTVALLAGTEAELPGRPGRWLGRRIEARVDRGEMLAFSGPEFPGLRLEVLTPDAQIVMTGTAISVYCDDSGTCVCVDEGTALVGAGPEDMEPVPAGRRKVVPRDAEPFLDDIMPPHREHIRGLSDRNTPAEM